MKSIKQNRVLKHVINWTLLIGLLQTSCHLQIGETHLTSHTLTEDSLSSGCLNSLDPAITKYLKGRTVSRLFNNMFECIKKSLESFKENARGNKKGEFTPNELRKFIHDFIMQNQVINDSLLHQLATLKTMIIGGTPHKLTIEDIDRLVVFLNVIKDEMLFLQPHIQALYNRNNTAYLINNNYKITSDFMKSVDHISVFLNQFAHSYSFSDMYTLIHELDLVIDNQVSLPNLQEQIQTGRMIKQFIVNGSFDVIQPHEWRRFLLGISHLINISIHYMALTQQTHLITPKNINSINSLIQNLMNFLSASVNSHSQNTIKEKELLRMTNYLQSINIIPQYFRSTSLRNMMQIILGVIFNTNKENYRLIELDPKRIKKMKLVINNWMSIQLLFNQAIKQSKNNIFSQNYFSKNVFPGQILKDIYQILSLKPFYQTSQQVEISHSVFFDLSRMTKHNYKTATLYNLYHQMIQMIQMGYQKTNLKTGMTHSELKQFFYDINSIAEDMGWFEKSPNSVLSYGDTEFILANTVTPSTQGFNPNWKEPEYITTREMTEYLAYTVSISSTLQVVEPALQKVCKPEVMGYKMACVNKHLLNLLIKNLPNLPDFKNSIKAMSNHKKQSFTKSLIHIAFETQTAYDSEKYITRWHLKNILMGVYFIETVFIRFDINNDFILDHPEIWKAFPIFEGYINRTVVDMLGWEEAVKFTPDLYAYVIFHKKLTHQTPHNSLYKGLNDWWDMFQLQTHSIWRNCSTCKLGMSQLPASDWTLQMDREHLINVFSATIKGFMEVKKRPIK